MAAIHVVPSSSESQLVSQYYFYSDYNPAEHFTYNRVFKEDGITQDDDITVDNQRKAFAKALEYHLSFEQVLPKENTEYVQFYGSICDPNSTPPNMPQDYIDMAEIDYLNVDETKLLQKIFKFPTKCQLTGQIKIDRQMDKSYSEMDLLELITLYTNLSTQQMLNIYGDATRWNLHCYQFALYCRVERPPEVVFKNGNQRIIQAVDPVSKQPLWYPANDQNKIIYTDINNNTIHRGDQYPILNYVNAFEFRKNIKLVNELFKTKIPAEDGWYRYDKIDKKWKFICNIQPTTKLNYVFEFAEEVN